MTRDAPDFGFAERDPLFGLAEPAPLFLPAPALDDVERLARLRLIRSRRVGPATYLRLMAEHGTAQSALLALPEIARAAGVEGYAVCPEGVVVAELRAARRAGARLLCLGDAGYPVALSDISDVPPILWAKGRLDLLDRPMLALVGTRNASALGTRMALDQGREVMAVPGHPMDSRASGTNQLIRDGAVLVRNAEDVTEAMGGPPERLAPARVSNLPEHHREGTPEQAGARRSGAGTPHAGAEARRTAASGPLPAPEGGVEGAILAALGPSPVAEDQLIRDLGRPPRTVAQALAILEMAGQITRSAGGFVARV
jgi:predicted Rossmann fold nucleotide-binding protein DprA/Smf involved in DNA uptake